MATLQITFRGMAPSAALEIYTREKGAKLERVAPALQSFRATIEAPHHHKQHGSPYRVRVDLAVPGKDLVIDVSHEDAYAAVDEAMTDAARALKRHAEIRRGEVKSHARR
jgi:ribosomal subunit interface protein